MNQQNGPQIGARGLRFYPDYFGREAQMALLAALRGVLARAPVFTPRMPKSGRPMSVGMSNCGPLGWISDERGYRYQSCLLYTSDAADE